MKQGYAEIVVVLDMSGSMQSMLTEAIGGYNALLKDQKALPGEATWTLVMFDHEYIPVVKSAKIQEVPDLDHETYRPRGTTALLDAIGRTIDDVGKRISEMSEDHRPEKVLLAILTDGMENASKDYSSTHVKEMIKHQEEKYGWTIRFLATSLDATNYAASQNGLGMNQKSVTYNASYASLASGLREEFSRSRSAGGRNEPS